MLCLKVYPNKFWL